MFKSLPTFLFYAGVLPLAIYTPLILFNADMGEALYWCLLLLIFLGAPWTLAWTNGWKVGLLTLIAASFSIILSFALMFQGYAIRTAVRWTLLSRTYKQEVLAQNDLDGLKHIDWDGWGWIGQDTDVYLVHDPNDRLRYALQVGNGFRSEGLPCDVAGLHRLEDKWYTITFFTDTSWDDC